VRATLPDFTTPSIGDSLAQLISGGWVEAYRVTGNGTGGSTGLPPEINIEFADGNNEGEDAISITQSRATASSASISSSSAGSISISSVNAQSSPITFLANYATGQISVEQSAALGVRTVDLDRLARIDPFDTRVNDLARCLACRSET
jgi:hypothetical protein